MSASQMVPMISPDGTAGDIPYERMNDARQAGFKPAIVMKAKDGSLGYIPADRYQEAAKSGLEIVPLKQQDTQHEGFWNHALSAAGEMLTPNAGTLLNAATLGMGSSFTALQQLAGAKQQLQQETKDERNPAYKAVAAIGPLAGVRVGQMERAANQGDVGGVAGEAAVPAVAALGTYGAAKLGPKVADYIDAKIPSKPRAVASLEDIKSTVGDVPIETGKVGDAALEMYEQSQRGATFPSAVNKLIKRMTAPDAAPLTYAEAKDFQSNISHLSANEQMSLKPNQVRLVGQLNEALKSSLADAADTVGKGAQFTQAMKEYHQAMKLKGYSDRTIDIAWKAALSASGLGGLGYAFKKIIGD